MRIVVGILLFASSLSAQLNPALANLARDPNEDKYIGKKEHVAAGKDLYMLMCSGCHGPSGEGGRGAQSDDRSGDAKQAPHRCL